jgi:hypothetical protein
MDLSNISLNGIGECTVYGRQEADSMSAMMDQDIKEKEGQDRGHDLVKQFYEEKVFHKESEPNLMAAREEGSQQELLKVKGLNVYP